MKKLLLITVLLSTTICIGCGKTEPTTTNPINTEIVTETEIVVTESELIETESTEKLYHVTADKPFEFEEAEQIYCQYEMLETPVTVYAITDGDIYGDPNYCNNTLMPQGAYSLGDECTFTMKTVYDGVEYFANKWNNGLIVIFPVSNFSTEPVEIDDIVENDQANNDEYLPDMGGMGGYIDKTIMESAQDSSALMEYYSDPDNWDPELLEMADGLRLY